MIDILIPTCKEYEQVQPLINEINRHTLEPHRIFASCQPMSASINRNLCHENAQSDIIVSMDDDITGFYAGWLSQLVSMLRDNDNYIWVSARYVDKNKQVIHQMHCGHSLDKPVTIASDDKCPSACIAYRKEMFDRVKKDKSLPNNKPYDEALKGSGFEDDDICIILKRYYSDKVFAVNNECRLIHTNEMKNQKGVNWELNKKHMYSKYPNHPRVWH